MLLQHAAESTDMTEPFIATSRATAASRWRKGSRRRSSPLLLLLVLLLPLLLLPVVSADAAQEQQQADSAGEDDLQAPRVNHDGTYSVSSLDDLKRFVERVSVAQSPSHSNLIAVLVHDPSCKPCQAMLGRWKQAVASIHDVVSRFRADHAVSANADNGMQDFPNRHYILNYPWFLEVDLATMPSRTHFTESLGINAVPAILMVRVHDTDSANSNITDYAGPMQALQDGLLHSMLRLSPSQYDYVQQHTLVPFPVQFHSEHQLRRYVQLYHFDAQSSILFRNTPIAYNPHYSQEEIDAIRYLMGDHDTYAHHQTAASTTKDPNYVIVQCRESHGATYPSEYSEFDQLAAILSQTQRLLTGLLYNCAPADNNDDVSQNSDSHDDKTLRLYLVNDETQRLEWQSTWQPPASHDADTTNAMSSMHDFMLSALTPSVMWLDRQSTAPIAMRDRVKVHAVLFVDFHNRDAISDSRHAIQALRHACQHQRGAVCLVVPSTDTRMLKSFDVDIWSPIDEWACSNKARDAATSHMDDDDEDMVPPSILPVLQIIDRRQTNQLRRYRLDHDFSTAHVAAFFQQFWSGTLAQPSAGPAQSTTNEYGVTVLQNAFPTQRRTAHVLALITSPTCGHSKRLSVVWNELAELLQYLGWQRWIEVWKMDGTSAMREDMVDVPYFPMIAYYAPDDDKYAPTALYDQLGAFGEEVGTLSDPTDILSWLFRVSDDLDVQEALGVLESMDE